MLTRLLPEIGCWYLDKERDLSFEVIAVDEAQGTVDIQYFHGEIEEMEIEQFVRLTLRRTEQPEDWTGPYEMDDDEMDQSASDAAYDDFPEFESDYMQITDQL